MKNSGEGIGITTTVPIEAIFASGCVPIDINNIFIASQDASADLALAESRGFPQSSCAWMKGLYGAIHRTALKRIIGVTQGDCSDTHALLDILKSEGLEVIPFAFPGERDQVLMQGEILKLCETLGTTLNAAEETKVKLDAVRAKALELDRMAYEENNVTGGELFAALINASDFQGDPQAHGLWCEEIASAARQRQPDRDSLRLGLLGIPPIFSNLIEVVEALGARIIYHELPRQFALPTLGAPLAESYTAYTYPYEAKARIDDILEEVSRRRLDGVIHYVQSFCHRRIHDRLLRERLSIPILTLEGDKPGSIDKRSLTRIEAFWEMLSNR